MRNLTTIIAYNGDEKIPFNFHLGIDCEGELLTANVFTIGIGYLDTVNSISENIYGGKEGEDRKLNIDLSNIAVGDNYSIVVRTLESGVIARAILVVLAKDGYSQTALV